MDGRTLACGAVAGVENIRHVAALARRVMEKTPHVLLVGEGAQLFAVQQGFPLETLHTPESVAEWEKARPKPSRSRGDRRRRRVRRAATTRSPCWPCDQKGTLGGVCTTSGLAHKLPGRVGDSPLIGAGLYVDDKAGAAGGTGVGEEIIRIGGSLLIVEAMRAGKSPQEACELAVRGSTPSAVRRGVHPARVAFLALDPKGRVGAACTTRHQLPVRRRPAGQGRAAQGEGDRAGSRSDATSDTGDDRRIATATRSFVGMVWRRFHLRTAWERLFNSNWHVARVRDSRSPPDFESCVTTSSRACHTPSQASAWHWRGTLYRARGGLLACPSRATANDAILRPSTLAVPCQDEGPEDRSAPAASSGVRCA